MSVQDNRLPFMSIVIPVPPGMTTPAVLSSIQRVDYPSDRMEVLISEGRLPPKQRNTAAGQARGDYLVFLDDDIDIPPGYLKNLARLYQSTSCVSLGGPSVPSAGGGIAQKAVAQTLCSWWGIGPLRRRYRKYPGSEKATDKDLILCNQSFRREKFLSFGGFDERLFPNEENELIDRIVHAGETLGYHPELAAARPAEKNLLLYWKKIFRYGQGRGHQLKIRSTPRGVEHLLFVAAGTIGLFLIGYAWPASGFALSFYGLWLAAGGLNAWLRTGCFITGFLTAVSTAGTHVSYIAGFWTGLILKLHSRPDTAVSIRKIPAGTAQTAGMQAANSRIAVLVMTYATGPTMTCRVVPMAKRLRALGTDFHVFALSESFSGIPGAIQVDGEAVRIIGQAHFRKGANGEKIRFGPFAYMRAVMKTLRCFQNELKTGRFDLVQVFTTDPGALFIALALKWRGYKVALDVDDSTYGMGVMAGYPAPILWLQWLLENTVPRLFFKTLSGCSFARARQYPGMALIPIQVSNEGYSRIAPPVSKETVTVLMLGNMAKAHLHFQVLEAIPKIITSNKNIKFCFIGTGECYNAIQERVKMLGIESSVELPGYLSREETIRRMCEADIGMCPMGDNPFDRSRLPMKILEYMAAGLCILTAPVGEVPHVIRHGENGWFYKPDNMEDFSRAVLTLAARPDIAEHLSKQAMQDVLLYQADKLECEWHRFYERAVLWTN